MHEKIKWKEFKLIFNFDGICGQHNFKNKFDSQKYFYQQTFK